MWNVTLEPEHAVYTLVGGDELVPIDGERRYSDHWEGKLRDEGTTKQGFGSVFMSDGTLFSWFYRAFEDVGCLKVGPIAKYEAHFEGGVADMIGSAGDHWTYIDRELMAFRERYCGPDRPV